MKSFGLIKVKSVDQAYHLVNGGNHLVNGVNKVIQACLVVNKVSIRVIESIRVFLQLFLVNKVIIYSEEVFSTHKRYFQFIEGFCKHFVTIEVVLLVIVTVSMVL